MPEGTAVTTNLAGQIAAVAAAIRWAAHHSPSDRILREALADARATLEAQAWRPIDTAPVDGSDILLFTTCHGQVEARFAPGRWSHTLEGDEYDGPVWVCADDAFQIEIEEIPPKHGGWHHGTATHWKPLGPKPDAVP